MPKRRWYDKDPLLKEALELLQIKELETKKGASNFLLGLQQQVASDVIDRIYDIVKGYENSGSRWYDRDPIMLKALETLKKSSLSLKKEAAFKILMGLSQDSFEGVEIEEE